MTVGNLVPQSSPHPRRNQGIAACSIGVVLILAWLVVPSVPGLILVGSLHQVTSICSSNTGIFAQAANAKVAASCTHAGYWTTALNVLGFAGLLLTVLGAVLLIRQRGTR